MVDPFIAVGAHVQLRAKWAVVRLALGALVHEGALRPRERCGFRVAFDEVLAHLRPDVLQHESQVPDDRIVAQDRVAGLLHIVHALLDGPKGFNELGREGRAGEWPRRRGLWRLIRDRRQDCVLLECGGGSAGRT